MRVKNHHKVSYIRKPMAKNSPMAVILAAAGLILTAAAIWLSIRSKGQAGLNAAACGFSSILFCLVGLWNCWKSFMEREKNYILAKIALIAGGIQLIFWLCMVIAGLMR